MKIAIDGMGGDFAPSAVIAGCIEALSELDVDIIITGKKDAIEEELKKHTYDKNRIEVIGCSEVIDCNEEPVKAIRRKKDSSLAVALQLVKEKKADAMISAGSTGAFMAGATFIVGRIKGIDRPALAPIMPGKNGHFMIIDCGANADCKPNYLVQFAMMGKTYYEKVMNVSNPSVGLINIGAEEEKGNELTKAAHKLLKDAPVNFIGNVEPRDIPEGDTNVLVCDGFVGNTVLKLYEGAASTLLNMIKDEIMATTRGKMGGLILKPTFKGLKKKFDYKEVGGAPFLGVDGVCIKAHGSSDGKAFKNSIRQAKIFHDNKVIETIKEQIEKEIQKKEQ